MEVNSIKVNMLGGFSVWVNGEPVVEDVSKLTKPWQLFCYLVLHREKFTSNRRLISMLWAGDDLTDPANVLKNAVYSLRKELCAGESITDSPIIYSTGGYRLDPNVELSVDMESFFELCQVAQSCVTEKKENLRKAVRAFGEFLPQLDQDLWVIPLALECRRKFFSCMHELCELLLEDKEYKEVLDLTSVANMYDPSDEINTNFMFMALDALKMYRVIVTAYSKTSQYFEDELGCEPPLEAQKVYNSASERINKTEQDIIVIKTEIKSTEPATRPSRGAFFCSYSSLKHMYAMMKRTAERNKQALVLSLFTLNPAASQSEPPAKQVKGQPHYDLTRAMAEFKVVAMNTLRKVDAISRYSRNQYVMLLTVSSLDDGRLVRDRIKESFAAAAAASKVSVDVKMTEV